MLSSKHLTVTTGPAKRRTAPKSRNTGGSTRKAPESSFLWASHKSQVAIMGMLDMVKIGLKNGLKNEEKTGLEIERIGA
ncbi:hypothetical protein Y695_02733 [Hydrogenophaga sp. T4]|nr:hypothetical protein Y695_02733 [Hydrogenophaga sp. T4]